MKKSVEKHLSESDPKCIDCLLKRWRFITCILLIVQINFRNQFKRNYLKNITQFLKVLLHFWNLLEISHIFKKRISLMAQIFGKLLTPKYVLPWIPKSSSFITPWASQSVCGSQALLKFERHRFYLNLALIPEKLSLKTSQGIRSKM